MSTGEDVAEVIHKTYLIENLLDQIIVKYCSPRKNAFNYFWSVILDSSIMQLGAKAKAVMAISQDLSVKIDQNALHQLISYRNAFAHHSIQSHPTVMVAKNPQEDELFYSLQVISQSGKVSKKRRDVTFEEFKKIFVETKNSLIGLLEAVKKEIDVEQKAP